MTQPSKNNMPTVKVNPFETTRAPKRAPFPGTTNFVSKNEVGGTFASLTITATQMPSTTSAHCMKIIQNSIIKNLRAPRYY
jgi:hypothetical protein